MSQSFIKISTSSKLVLEKIISKRDNQPYKFISIIGKGRTGKSAFLNCLVQSWENINDPLNQSDMKNVNIFKTGSSDEHCTNGVDIYIHHKTNMVLMDFQGIYVDDASNDHKLLLLAYLVSDIIIFNEPKLLSSATLSLFEPMLAFMNYITPEDSTIKHPKLIFRISDKTLALDQTTNMHKLLQPQDDQFQMVRDCIQQLFDDPFAVCTNSLDRKELVQMTKDNFSAIMESHETGFKKAINQINNYLSCIKGLRTMDEFIKDVPRIIKNINDDQKIEFKKLDVIKNLASKEILTIIGEINKEIYQEIAVDGSQETYDKNVVSRQLLMDTIVKDIHKKFKATPKYVRDENLAVFIKEVGEVIQKAHDLTITKATELLNTIINRYKLADFSLPRIACNRGYNKFLTEIDYNIWIKPLEDIFDNITTNIQHLFHEIRDIFINGKKEILSKIHTSVEIHRGTEQMCIDYYISKCTRFVKNAASDIDNIIMMIVKSKPLETSYEDITKEIIPFLKQSLSKEFIDEDQNVDSLRKNILTKQPKYFVKMPNVIETPFNEVIIDFKDVGDDVSARMISGINVILNKTFEDMFVTYVNILSSCEVMVSDNTDLIVKHRNILLADWIQKSENLVLDYKIIINNPKTDFILINMRKLIDITWIVMTYDQYKNTIEKDIQCIECIFLSEGFIFETGFFEKVIDDVIMAETGEWTSYASTTAFNCRQRYSNLKRLLFSTYQYETTVTTTKEQILISLFWHYYEKLIARNSHNFKFIF